MQLLIQAARHPPHPPLQLPLHPIPQLPPQVPLHPPLHVKAQELRLQAVGSDEAALITLGALAKAIAPKIGSAPLAAFLKNSRRD